MKIRKSASKRFKATKKGKILFAHQYQGHLKFKKSKRRRRRQSEPGQLKGIFAQKIKRMLGVA